MNQANAIPLRSCRALMGLLATVSLSVAEFDVEIRAPQSTERFTKAPAGVGITHRTPEEMGFSATNAQLPFEENERLNIHRDDRTLVGVNYFAGWWQPLPNKWNFNPAVGD